nr:hypothetical protein [uncultured Bacteroides sp.]
MRMKRKVYISCLTVRLGLFFLLAFTPWLLFAQEDNTRFIPDSIRIRPELKELLSSPLKLSPGGGIPSSTLQSKYFDSVPRFSLKGNIHLPYHTNPSPLFMGDYRTGGILKSFSRGAFYGSGGQTSLPGIGRINDASLGYRYAFSPKLQLQGSINAMKINMIHTTGQTFNTSGALLYHPSERLAFKVFGTYAFGNSYGMDASSYGATMSLDMTERFGMEVGVQRYYDSMRGRWETVPIVIPYFNVNKLKLGLDVGGILYEIFRSTVFDKNDKGGATLAPPRFQMPPLRRK